MVLFLRIQAGCPYMATCCFLLTEDDYQQFSAQVPRDNSGPLPETQNTEESHPTLTSCSEQLQALDSARLLHNHRRQALGLLCLQNMNQQSRETEKKVLGSPSTTSSLAVFHF